MSIFKTMGHPSVADYVTKARTTHSVSPHDVSGSRSPADLGVSITLPGATGGLGGGAGHPSAPDPTLSLYPSQIGIGTEGYQPRNFVENTFNPRLTSGHPSAPNKYSPSGYGGTRGRGSGVSDPFAAGDTRELGQLVEAGRPDYAGMDATGHPNPSDFGVSGPTQNYGPAGQLNHSVYDPRGPGGHLEGVPTVPEWYGPAGQLNHSVYEPDPILTPGPGPGYYGQSPMSGNDQWIPENPMSPASTYGGLPGAGPSIYGGPNNADGQVLDPLGVGAGPSNQFSPLNAAIGDVIDPVGIGAGPSDMYGTAPNRGGPGSDADGYGAGPGMYGQTPEQGEDSVPYNLIEGTPSIGEGMNQLGIGGTRTTNPTTGEESVNAQNPETAIRNYEVEKKLDDDLMAAKEERWAAASGKEERQQYLDDLKAIQKKQRILYAMAAFSGNQQLATLASNVAAQDTAVLNQKYEWAEEDRLGRMQDALMRDENGNYDPPKSVEEFNQAMNAMGASTEERDWFAEQFFGDGTEREDNTYRNFINTRTGETYSGYGPPDESGAWAITGQYDYGTKDGKTPGGVDMEKYQIWQEAKRANEEGTMSDEELGDLKRALGLSDRGITLNQEYAMFESMYKGERGAWKIVGPDGKTIRRPTAEQIEKEFERFRTEVIPRLRGIMPDETEDGSDRPTKDEYIAMLKKKGVSEDEIEKKVKEYYPDE